LFKKEHKFLWTIHYYHHQKYCSLILTRNKKKNMSLTLVKLKWKILNWLSVQNF